MSKKVAIVTGGTSGIGRATALALQERGYTVYELSRRAEGMPDIRHIVADITKEETLQAAVEQVLETAKTKRYAYARLRRMVLWAYLGLTPGDCSPAPPYLRPLAANESGRQILAEMRERARVPVLTRAGSVRRLDARAQALFVLESRAADL